MTFIAEERTRSRAVPLYTQQRVVCRVLRKDTP